MQYRRLGKTGMKVSSVSLGAWTTYGGSVEDKKLIQTIIEKALEHGINFFDNADIFFADACQIFLKLRINPNITRYRLGSIRWKQRRKQFARGRALYRDGGAQSDVDVN